MSRIDAGMKRIEERFTDWAEGNPDVRAAFVVGSRARTHRPADQWSDLDVVQLSTDPDRYLNQTDWLDAIGTVWFSFLEKTATGGSMERRVLFDGALDVDFAIFGVEHHAELLRDPSTPAVVRRGMRVLVDKDGFGAELLALAASDPALAQPPTHAEFLQATHDFWYHAMWAAKKLRRGEVMMAKGCCDGLLNRLLIDFARCQARVRNGWEYDTWHSMRFFETWADPAVLEGMRGTYGRFDAEETWRALLATMDLFRRVSREVADALDFAYPALADERVTAWVRRAFEERNR